MMSMIRPLLFLTCLGLLSITGCKKTEVISNLPVINDANNRIVGASANDLLSASKFSSVKVEIQYMPGYQPNAAAVNNLQAFLNGLLNKPGGITIVQTQIAASGKPVLTLQEIGAIEKNNRTVYNNGSQLGVYFLYTDANYEANGVLGVAFRNTSMCLMGKTIHDNSGGLGQTSRTKLETTVLKHEFAHILGLVDLGSAMQTNHKDAAHGNHCNNNNCLMYYASETTEILGVLLTGNIPDLDANCKADLTANGGK